MRLWSHSNGRLLQECLNENWLLSPTDAEQKVEAWRTFFDQVRPHSALRWSTPSDYARKYAVSGRLKQQLEPDIPLTPERRIKELEQQLDEANQKAQFFESVVDVLQKDYGCRVIKKRSGKSSRKSRSKA